MGPRKRRYRRICAFCGEEFKASRRDAKACSSRCRKALSRDNALHIRDTEMEIRDSEPEKPWNSAMLEWPSDAPWLSDDESWDDGGIVRTMIGWKDEKK